MIYKEPIPNKSIWKSQQDEVEWLKRKHMLFSKTPKPVPDFYAKLNAFVVAADGDYLTRSYHRFKKAIHTAPEAEENRVQQVIYEAMKKADKSMSNGWEGSARATLHSALTEQTEELLNHPSSKVEWFKEWEEDHIIAIVAIIALFLLFIIIFKTGTIEHYPAIKPTEEVYYPK